MQKKVTLIKLGGSIITNKEVPMMVRSEILARLVREITKAQCKTNELYIIGHGQGSFAHAPALRYRTMEGFVLEESAMGMAITQDSASQLNRKVVRQFLKEQVPAVSFLFSNSMVTKNSEAEHWCGAVLLEYLQKGLTPITCGDVLVDSKIGCTIWSTEKILGYIADALPKEQYAVEKIVHVTEVAGVLDSQNSVIPHISQSNIETVKKMMRGTKGFDVTGGMWHKIEESRQLAQKGISAVILSGMNPNTLYNCLIGSEFDGTHISA